MATLTYRTAGESHGKALIALVEGMPAGVPIDKALIDGELRRRQGGYGRGGGSGALPLAPVRYGGRGVRPLGWLGDGDDRDGGRADGTGRRAEDRRRHAQGRGQLRRSAPATARRRRPLLPRPRFQRKDAR